MAKDKALVGAAGVHHVGFQLSSRGYAVGLTSPGVEDVDLLSTNSKTGKSIAIQVKTMTDAYVNSRKHGPYWKWRIGRHLAEDPPHDGLFLAFVDLRGGPLKSSEPPDVFIVPWNDLGPFIDKYPADFWCDIPENAAPNHRNRWDLIDAALA